MRKIPAILLSLVLIVCGSVFPVSAEAAPDVVFIFTGESEGRLEGTDSVIGMETVATLFKAQKAEVPATFLFDAGDTIQGNFFSNNNKGESAIDIMNTVQYDAMVLGNHEFDFGYARLLELAKSAKFSLLTQPTVFNKNEPLSHSTIIERGGYKIGVFGLTTPATKQISSASDTDFGTPVSLIEYAKKSARSLRENGADIVICLSHIGNSDNFSHDYGSVMDISESVLGIDVIIDGHSDNDIVHSELNTPILLSDGGESLGIIKFYREGNGFRIDTDIRYKADVESVKPDAKTQAVVEKWKKQTDVAGKEVIGKSGADITDYEKGIIRTQESALGNLLSDAVKEIANADIALINSGTIRAPLNKGDITWYEVNNIVPYSNYILVADVKGSVIRAALENSVALRGTENAGGFLQVSGINFSFDPSLPEYSRVTDVTVNNMPLNDKQIYSLAVPDFIANGGDEYHMLPEAFANAVSKGDLTAALAEYLKVNGENVSAELEGRILILDNSDTATNQNTFIIILAIIAIVVAGIGFVIIIIQKRRRENTDAR